VNVQSCGPAALTPGKRPDTHSIRGWVDVRYRSMRMRENSHPPGSDPRTVQLIASSCCMRILAENWLGSSPIRPTPGHVEGKFYFNFFISATCLKNEFLTFRPSRMSPLFLRSWQLPNSLPEPDLRKFRLEFIFGIDRFMGLRSEPRRIARILWKTSRCVKVQY